MGAALIVLIIGVAIFAAVRSVRLEEARKKTQREELNSLKPDELFLSDDCRSALGFKFASRTVILLANGKLAEYAGDRIAAVEMLRDQMSLSSTNRGSQAVGAVVGGLALGGVGLLAGALSGSKRTAQRFTKLELKVIVDCTTSPVYVVEFFKTASKKGVGAEDRSARKAIEQMERLHGHLVNVIRNSDRERQRVFATIPQPPSVSEGTSDLHRLRELFDLKQIGAISEEEYERAKRSAFLLLGSARPGAALDSPRA